MLRPLIARSDTAKIRRKLMKTRGSKKAEGLDAFFFIEFFYRTDPPQRPSDIRRNRPVKSCRRAKESSLAWPQLWRLFLFPGPRYSSLVADVPNRISNARRPVCSARGRRIARSFLRSLR